MTNGHWTYKEPINPMLWFGFTYMITNNVSGKKYIGKKQFFNYKKKTLKGKKNKVTTIAESNWRSYQSSCIYLKDDIEKLGKDKFTFEILNLCPTRSELTYNELELQFANNVLKARDANGNKIFYNGNIGNKTYGIAEERFIRTPSGDYQSLAAAARHYNVTDATIGNWIKNNKDGFTFEKLL